MPSFKDYGLRGIKRYPEIFSALEEFERTKRIPKFSYRKRIDITIDEHLLKRFKEHCREHGLSMSRLIEKQLKEALQRSRTDEKRVKNRRSETGGIHAAEINGGS